MRKLLTYDRHLHIQELVESYYRTRFDEPQRQAGTRLQTKLRDLASFADCAPHYADETFLREYAAAHQRDLLRRREAIRHAYMELRRDTAFMTHVMEHAPHLVPYLSWEVRALAFAEEQTVEHASIRLTPEGRRERELDLMRTKAEDSMAKLLLQLELSDTLRKELEERDVDEDVMERMIYLFESDFVPPDDDMPDNIADNTKFV